MSLEEQLVVGNDNCTGVTFSWGDGVLQISQPGPEASEESLIFIDIEDWLAIEQLIKDNKFLSQHERPLTLQELTDENAEE